MRALVTLLLFMLVSLTASAGVYRWVDEDGRVHYGDQPPPKAERLDYDRSRARSAPPPAEPEAPAEEDAEQPPVEEEPTPFAAGKEDATPGERCTEFRARVARYQAAGNLFVERDDGSREELAPEEREDLVARTQAMADEACAEAGES